MSNAIARFACTVMGLATLVLGFLGAPPGAWAQGTWTPTQASGAPSGRYNHTAIWTGTRMIVWGGLTPSVTNTGGRYDPVTDSWTSTSTSGAPAARENHTAVWTGTWMVVWGGNNGSTLYDAGGRYDSATNSWTLMANPVSFQLVPRKWHTAVWTGTEMVVWGGWSLSNAYQKTGGRYNPSSNSWLEVDWMSAPGGRNKHTAVWTGTDMIVWGGEILGGFTNTGAWYRPSINTWPMITTTSGAPAARAFHSAVWTGTYMVVWGGRTWTGSALNTGGRFKLSDNTWNATASGGPAARWDHTAVWSGTEMIVWGGTDGTSYFADGSRFNPAPGFNGTWNGALSAAGAPAGRYDHTSVWTGDLMIPWGGRDASPRNDGGRWSPVNNNPPAPPSAVDQYRADAATVIPLGQTLAEDKVVFKATATDPEGNAWTLDVEMQPIGTSFSDTATLASPLTASGAEASVSSATLAEQGYHWQYRLVDELGAATAWTSFGANPETDADFAVGFPTIACSPPSLSFDATEGAADPGDQSFDVTNSGAAGSTLNYTISDDASWLTLTPTTGALADAATQATTVSVDTNGLTAGTYAATITVSDPAATNNPQTVDVTLTVWPPPPAIGLSVASLSFAGTQGGPNPPAQSFDTINTGPAGSTLNYTISDDAAWLTAAPTFGTLSGGASDSILVSVDLGGLAAGSYSAAVTVSDAAATNNPQSLSVDLTVDPPPPTIGLSTASLSYSAVQDAANPADQSFEISNAGPSGSTLAYTISDDAAWLTPAPSSGTLPGAAADTIACSVNTTGLAAGSYTATVTVSDPGATNTPQTLSVDLTIDPPPSEISLSTAALSFLAQEGGDNPADQSFTLTNSGPAGSTLSFLIDDDAPWLTVSPAGGTLAAGASSSLTCAVDVTGLSQGTLTATITIAGGGAPNSPQAVPVSLVVSEPSAPATLSVSPTSLSFTAVQGGASPPAQAAAIGNTGGTATSFSTSSDAPWVWVTPASGDLPPGESVSLSVAATSADLAAGSYDATVTISASGATDSPQVVAVSLTIAPPPPAIGISPTSLSFEATEGDVPPASRSFTITNTGPAGSALEFALTGGSSWLTSAPATGALSSGESATVECSVNPDGMPPGSTSAQIAISDPAATNSPRTVSVTLDVLPADAAAAVTISSVWPDRALVPSEVTIVVSGSGFLGGGESLTQARLAREGRPPLAAARLRVASDARAEATFLLEDDVSGGWRSLELARGDGESAALPSAVFLRRFYIESVLPAELGPSETFDMTIRVVGPGPFEALPLSFALEAPDGLLFPVTIQSRVWEIVRARGSLSGAPPGGYALIAVVDGTTVRRERAVRLLPFVPADPRLLLPTPRGALLSDGRLSMAVPFEAVDPNDPPRFELIGARATLPAVGVRSDPDGSAQWLVAEFRWNPEDRALAGTYDLLVSQADHVGMTAGALEIAPFRVRWVAPQPIPNPAGPGIRAADIVEIEGEGFEPGVRVRMVFVENPWKTFDPQPPQEFLVREVEPERILFDKQRWIPPGFYDLVVENSAGGTQARLPSVAVGRASGLDVQVYLPLSRRPAEAGAALVVVRNDADFPMPERSLRLRGRNIEILEGAPGTVGPLDPGQEARFFVPFRAFRFDQVPPEDRVNSFTARAWLTVEVTAEGPQGEGDLEQTREILQAGVEGLESLSIAPDASRQDVGRAVSDLALASQARAEPLLRLAAASKSQESLRTAVAQESDILGVSVVRVQGAAAELSDRSRAIAPMSEALQNLRTATDAAAQGDWAEAGSALWDYGGNLQRAAESLTEEYGSGEALQGIQEQVRRLSSYFDPEYARTATRELQILGSRDPNDKLVGNEGEVVQDLERISYMIRFENLAPEEGPMPAPALVVEIEDILNGNLDPATVEFGAVSHPNALAQAAVDRATGRLFWRFEDLNLPPNVNPPEGEGFVTFTVLPKPGTPSGTVIPNIATITFDPDEGNDPIDTPRVTVMLDTEPPAFREATILARSDGRARLRLDAQDDASGVRHVRVYGRSSPLGLWAHYGDVALNSPTEVEFVAEPTAEFDLVAIDRAGNRSLETRAVEGTSDGGGAGDSGGTAGVSSGGGGGGGGCGGQRDSSTTEAVILLCVVFALLGARRAERGALPG